MAVWDYQAANLQPGHKLTDAKLAVLNKAVLATCGSKSNGVSTDAFLADPPACKFEPATLTCKGAESDACLTPAEVQTARAFYSGPLNHAGKPLYYGWMPGSEAPGRSGLGVHSRRP